MLTNNIFTRAAQTWELDRLALAIINIKSQEGDRAKLTTEEKVILCGLLSGYHPEEISRQLPESYSNLSINTIRKTYNYLKKIAARQLNTDPTRINDIITSLSEAGYKKSYYNSLKNSPKNVSESSSLFLQDETIVLQQVTDKDREIIPNQPKPETKSKAIELPLEHQQTITPESKKNTKYSTKRNSSLANIPTDNHNFNRALAKNYLPSTIDAEIVPSVSRWTTIGGLVTMGLVGIGVVLAAIIKYDVTVKAEATVRPEGEIKLVQASREGKIKSIQVKENQQVKQGEIIAYLDYWELQNKYEQLTTNLRQSKLQLTQIDAQINSLETQIVAETEKSNRSITSAEAELKSTQTEYQQNKLTTQAQVKEATAKLNIARQELAKAKTELNSVEASLKSSQAALASATKKRDRYQKILSSGAISQEQFEEAQLAVQQQLQTVESQKATVLGQKQTIESQKQEISAAYAQLSRSQAALNPDYAVVEIAQQQIEREKANKRTTIASHLREKEALIQQRLEIEKQITQEEQQLQQLAQEINQSIIRATADGKVLKLNLRNHNQVVNPQDSIAEIAPTSSNLVVKAHINPQDRDRVAKEQLVKLKIDACPYPDYGILPGKVTAISADTVTSQNNEQKYYTAEISPAAESLTRGDKTCQLRSGMEVTADIITKAETPLQFFLRQARLITDL
jgi:multidrug efflux pump subunit AcrA (membrane-fusion protein)